VKLTFAWLRLLRPLACDYELLRAGMAALHIAAFVCLALPKLLSLIAGSRHSLRTFPSECQIGASLQYLQQRVGIDITRFA
jgi:hypothetical protein